MPPSGGPLVLSAIFLPGRAPAASADVALREVVVAATEGVRVWALGGTPVVSTPDELDLIHADNLRAALRSALGEHVTVIVDMTQTSFCDSGGISALIEGAREAAASERQMRIAVSSAQVLRVFALTGVSEVLTVFPGLHQALAARPAAAGPDQPATDVPA
jgi:anti-sigma B factor antagonist